MLFKMLDSMFFQVRESQCYFSFLIRLAVSMLYEMLEHMLFLTRKVM